MQCISVSHSRKAGRRNGIFRIIFTVCNYYGDFGSDRSGGIFAGKKLRENKDAKAAAEADMSAEQEVK